MIITTRDFNIHWKFQHLRLFLDNSDTGEIQQFFDAYYSHIYYIVYEHFINTEQNLRQKGAHKVSLAKLMDPFTGIGMYKT